MFEQALEELADDGEIERARMDTARDLYYHHSACFIYLGCFSEEGDILPQWRSYADDGQGFAIGFSLPEMDFDCPPSISMRTCQQILSEKVIYMREEYGEQFLPLAKNWIRMRLTRGRHLNDREIRRAIADDAAFSSSGTTARTPALLPKKNSGPFAAGAAEGSGGHMAAGNRKAYRQIRFRPEASRWCPIRKCPLPKAPSGKWCWGPKMT